MHTFKGFKFATESHECRNQGGTGGICPPKFSLYKLLTTLCVVLNCCPQSKSLSYAYESILSLVGTSFLYRPNPSAQLPGDCLSGGDPGPQSVLSETETKDTEVLPSLCQCGRGWEEQVGGRGWGAVMMSCWGRGLKLDPHCASVVEGGKKRFRVE